MTYRDRQEAGRCLASELPHHRGSHPLVLGIPRGGVVLAAEVAAAMDGELDAIVARKVGAPFSPELAIGAVTASGPALLDFEMIRRLGIGDDAVRQEVERSRAEVARRAEAYRGSLPLEVTGRVVIVVDDGVATGATLFAALRAVRAMEPDLLSCAVPVGPPVVIDKLAYEADEVVCPLQPRRFRAVGEWYRDFGQTSDAEVVALLQRQT